MRVSVAVTTYSPFSSGSPAQITGMYKGGAFTFSFAINTNYPHDPPKVKCTQTVCILVAAAPSQQFVLT